MKAKEVLNILKVHRQTLYNYKRKGIIKAKVLSTGRIDYDKEDVYKLANINIRRKSVLYCRVSTKNQKKDLLNQEETLKLFCNKNGIQIEGSYKDIGSGINFERQQFQQLLLEILDYKIEKIFITYRDRLSRLSFNLFKQLFEKFGCEIIILNDIDSQSDSKIIEKEIFQEIIDLIHCFTMKIYSNRRKEKLKLIEKQLELEKNDI